MNYGQKMGDQCKGMAEKYRQVFIEAQRQLAAQQKPKPETWLLSNSLQRYAHAGTAPRLQRARTVA
jgi:hypothetical protein